MPEDLPYPNVNIQPNNSFNPSPKLESLKNEEEVTSVGFFPLPEKKSKIKFFWLFLGLLLIVGSLLGAIYLVQQRQEIRKEAEEASPFILKSEKNQGVWKQVDHDGYPGCTSASTCSLSVYSPVNGWTTLTYDDSSWETKDFTVDSNWWHQQDLDWKCKDTYFSSSPDTINIIDDINGTFPNTNGVTALYRRKFNLTIPDGFRIEQVQLKMFSDNKTAVFLNGNTAGEGQVLVGKELCYTVDINSALLRQGDNILAIQLSNDKINQFDNPMGLQYELKITFVPFPYPTPTPTRIPTPTLTSTPTPGPLTCLSLNVTPPPTNLRPGQSINLICLAQSITPVNHFEFRVKIGSADPTPLASSSAVLTNGNYRGQIQYVLPSYSCYRFECRPCLSSDSSSCTSWFSVQP